MSIGEVKNEPNNIRDIDSLDLSDQVHFQRNRIVLRGVRLEHTEGSLLSIEHGAFKRFLRRALTSVLSDAERRELRDDIFDLPAPGMKRLLTYVDVAEDLLDGVAPEDVEGAVAQSVIDSVTRVLQERASGDTIET